MPIQVKEASENNFKPTFLDNSSDKSDIKTIQSSEEATVRKIKTAPSPVISMYCNNLVVHLTLDCGAEAPCITPAECKRLGLAISPPSQLAKSVDHSKLKVIGETRTIFTRGPLKLEFEALVIPHIDGATILAGSPFFVQHEFDICYSSRTVKVGRKYSIPWTPSQFIETPAKSSRIIRIKKTTVLLKGDTVDLQVPADCPPNSSFVVYPHSDKLNDFNPQEIEAVGHTLKVFNNSEEPLILEKNMHAFAIRTMKNISKIQEHKPFKQLPVYKHPEIDPEQYLCKLKIDPDNIIEQLPDGKKVLEALDKVNKEHHIVFNSDLSQGYNGASGPCFASWDFIQEPPVTHGKVPNFTKEDQLYKLQLKIDHLHAQGIVRKPEELGINLKLVNPIMMVKKTSSSDKSWSELNPITDTRAVLAANILNEWSEDVPGDSVTPVQHLSKVTKHRYHITTDMENSFDQIRVAKNKLPYMGFNSPYKGQFIFTRSGQGRKGSSEKLKELTSMCYGHLIADGSVAIIHDDIHIGGQTPEETVENWRKFLLATKKNNIKINAKKTIFFPKKFDCVGFTIDGQFVIPNAHRKNALKNYNLPVTVGQLRSYLGLYKTFLRNQKDQAQILHELNQLVGNNHKTNDNVNWSEEAKLKFYESQSNVDTIVSLYNPKPEDQLILTWDWCEKRRAIGAILWAVIGGKKLVCGYFSHMLDKTVKKKLIPCEGEALASKLAIFAFRTILHRAKNVVIGLTDNEIFFQASKLLAKGHLSTSQKLNALAMASESANVEIQHLSGKMGFNFVADQFSRFPTNCDDPEKCEICRFVKETVQTCDAICVSRLTSQGKQSPCSSIYAVRTENFKLSSSLILHDEFLRSEQERDPVLQKVVWYISNRRRPTDRDTSCNKVKSYLRYAKDRKNKGGYLDVNKKGVLVVTQTVPGVAGKVEKPVIPDHLANAFLAQLHMKRNHPKLNQMLTLLQNNYLILQPKPRIMEIINRCLICNADEFISNKIETYSSSEPPNHPYEKVAADVMKRGGSLILVITDNLTAHTSSSLIRSEKSEDLEKSLLKTILPFKNCHSKSSIRVDTAPGFQKLFKNSKKLDKLDIILDLGRPKNKNSNAVVDKRIRELEDELRKISPEGMAVTEEELILATKFLNERIRQHGFSANELLFRRKQESNQELDLKDSELKLKVHTKRMESHDPSSKSKATIKLPTKQHDLAVGQVGFIRQEKSKHSVRPAYFVTEVIPDKSLIKAKKMLHAHSEIPTKFQNINYEIKMSDFVPAKSQINTPSFFDSQYEVIDKDFGSSVETKTKFKPLPRTVNEDLEHTYDDSSDESEDHSESEEVDNIVEAENMNLNEDDNHDDQNDEYEGEEDEVFNNRREGPRRAKVRARENIREWIELEQNDGEYIQGEQAHLNQLDGAINTPDSLTPDTSPNKTEVFMQKRAVRVISDFYLKCKVKNGTNSLRPNNTGSSFIEMELDPLNSNSDSETSYVWDNYRSSPEMSALPWDFADEDHDQNDSRIQTQYFFNRNHQWTSPTRFRGRIRSYSHEDLRQIVPATEFEIQNEENPEVQPFCFRTRVFFRRLRQVLSSSRSNPNLKMIQ